jgi:threonine/homoserine/homoserine lactone efflux protein
LADVVVVFLANSVRGGLAKRPKFLQRLREGSGLVICGLGASLALAKRAS